MQSWQGLVGMTSSTKLILVKLLHTAVWLLMAGATFLALHNSLIHRFDTAFFVSIALISAEVLVLLVSRFKCPLTSLAERYTKDRQPEFDIYLPRWVAKHNIRIFTTIFVLGVLGNLLSRV